MSELSSVQQVRRKKNISTWTGAALVAGIVLLANFIVGYVPVRLDTSEGRIYSISDGTKNLLGKLDDQMIIKLYFSSKLPAGLKINEQYIRDILSEYKRASGGKIRIEYSDPSKSEKLRKQAIQAGIAPVKLDVRERDRRELKECFMGVSIIYGDQSEVIPFIQETGGLEYDLSQRIKRLINPEKSVVGVISNAGALTFESEALAQLKQLAGDLLEIRSVDLEQPLPENLNSLWFIGPSEAVPDSMIEILRNWVNGGGTLGLLIDQYAVNVQQFRLTPRKIGFDGLLSEWGISVKSGVVGDLQADRIQVQSNRGGIQWINLVDYPYFPLTSQLDRDHPATKGVDVMSLPFVSALSVAGKDGLSYTPLVKSSKYSWINPLPGVLSPLQQHLKPSDKESGPFDLALLVEGQFGSTENESKGRLILFGTSLFVRTDYPPRSQNFSVFMNLLDWSVQEDALLSIRSAGAPVRPLRAMGDGARMLVKYSLILFLPLLSLIIGLIVWRRAKLRRQMLPLTYKEA